MLPDFCLVSWFWFDLRFRAFKIFSPKTKIVLVTSNTTLLDWLWNLLVNLYIWLTPLILGLIERDGGLNTLCHSCVFACQQRVLKTSPDTSYLRLKDWVVWIWHLLGNFYIYIHIFINTNKIKQRFMVTSFAKGKNKKLVVITSSQIIVFSYYFESI